MVLLTRRAAMSLEPDPAEVERQTLSVCVSA
jgi:hypothetical protein